MYKDEGLKVYMKQIEATDRDYISISCKRMISNNEKIIEVVNISSEEISYRLKLSP